MVVHNDMQSRLGVLGLPARLRRANNAGGVVCSALSGGPAGITRLNEARVRGNGLPLACTSHKHIGEPNHDIVSSAFELAHTPSSARHHRRVAEYARLYVVDLEIVDP